MERTKRLVLVMVLLSALVATTLGASAQAINPGVGSTDVRVMNLNITAGSPAIWVSAEYVNQAGFTVLTKSVRLNSLASFDFMASASGLPDGWRGSMIVSATGEVAAISTTTYVGGSAPASVGSYRGFGGGPGIIYLPNLQQGSYDLSQRGIGNLPEPGISAFPGEVAATDTAYASGSAPASVNSNRGSDAGATTIYFPNLQQRPWQYSGVVVQNADSGTAEVRIYYYARNGTPYAGNPVTDSIPGGAQRTYDLSRKGVDKVPNLGITTPPGDGWIGAMRVVSTNGKQLVGAVANFNPTYSTAYPAALQGAGTLYFAAISRRVSSGNWLQFSGTIVQNLSETEPAAVHVYVTDRAGTAVFDFTDTIPALSAHGYNTRFQADTPVGQWAAFQAAMGDNFNGAMYVTSDRPIVGVTDQQSLVAGFVGQFSYLGEASGGASMFAPQVFRQTCSGIVCQKSTGVIVYNPDPAGSASVTVRFIGTAGNILYQFNDTIPARLSHGYNTRVQADTPAADFDSLKAALGDNFQGSVWVTSTRPVIGVAQHFIPNEGDAYNAHTR